MLTNHNTKVDHRYHDVSGTNPCDRTRSRICLSDGFFTFIPTASGEIFSGCGLRKPKQSLPSFEPPAQAQFCRLMTSHVANSNVGGRHSKRVKLYNSFRELLALARGKKSVALDSIYQKDVNFIHTVGFRYSQAFCAQNLSGGI